MVASNKKAVAAVKEDKAKAPPRLSGERHAAERTQSTTRPVLMTTLRMQLRHGRGITDERVIKLVIHDNPDGKYLVKGGPKVWKKFRLRKEHRRLQGIIHGKRGVTENLGAAAVKRWKKSQQPELPDDSSQHASRVGFAQNLLKE